KSLILLACLTAAARASTPAVTYTIEDVGAAFPNDVTRAWDVDNFGNVVATQELEVQLGPHTWQNLTHSYIWSDGAAIAVFDQPEGNSRYIWLTSISDSGLVAGTARKPSFPFGEYSSPTVSSADEAPTLFSIFADGTDGMLMDVNKGNVAAGWRIESA